MDPPFCDEQLESNACKGATAQRGASTYSLILSATWRSHTPQPSGHAHSICLPPEPSEKSQTGKENRQTTTHTRTGWRQSVPQTPLKRRPERANRKNNEQCAQWQHEFAKLGRHQGTPTIARARTNLARGDRWGNLRVDVVICVDICDDKRGLLDGKRMVIVAVETEPLVILVRIGVPKGGQRWLAVHPRNSHIVCTLVPES